MDKILSVEQLQKLSPEELLARPTAELDMLAQSLIKGNDAKGILPIRLEMEREKALDSPAYLATEIIDPYYKDNFEPVHYQLMDEVLAPYILGETVKLDGTSYDPKDFVGLIIEFSRDTFKSSLLGITLLWCYLYTKIRLKRDTRAMYVHQVLLKAIQRGEVIRNIARMNQKFRERFPEFRGPVGEWDTKNEWRWPSFTSFASGEFSFTAYGETSDKTGGHYTFRAVDDWETEDSVTNPNQLAISIDRFKAMDPLRDRTIKFNPLVIAGTTYHHQGLYKTLEREGGYLIWKVPAHKGSPKAIFDLCSLDPKIDRDRKKIKLGIKRLVEERSGDLNFPKRLDWQELYNSARSQGPRIYNCQMLLNPTPEGEARFDIEALNESWVDEIPQSHEMHLYIRCDPAISEKADADETAIVVGGVHWGGDRYLIDGWIGREKQPNKIVLKCFDLAEKWQAKRYKVMSIGFEEVAFQTALRQMAKYGIGERPAQYTGETIPMRTKPCPVRGISRSADRNKHERLLEMDGPITRRGLKFWKRCSIAQKVMTQFKNFPFDRFDGLDATHDLWINTITPPPPETVTAPDIPVEFLRAVRKMNAAKEPRLIGTNNTVTLGGGW